MSPRLILMMLIGASSGTALAQSQPQLQSAPLAQPVTGSQPAPQAQPSPPAKPKMVTKTICRRVDNEETTGSRLGSAPKVCTTVEVPARPDKGERGLR